MNQMLNHALGVSRGERFGFGANWARFLKVLNEERLEEAEKSLKNMLGVSDLSGKRFLDAGSGSGLFSLAARRLGARVHSFDYDPRSVACTQELKRRYFPEDRDWLIVKKTYARSPILRWPLLVLHVPYLWCMRWLARMLTRRLKLECGMSLWHGVVDWIGGYPFEVAPPEAVVEHYLNMGFTLEKMKTCGARSGCNEFVFVGPSVRGF